MSRCPGHRRHWFAYYREVGTSSPTCRRCGAANPNYDPARDPNARRPTPQEGHQ